MELQHVRVERWQESGPPQEQQLRMRMREQRLSPYTWSNGPGDRYAVHSHAYEKVLYCVQGTIRFVLPDQPEAIEYIDLAPGDCMILPAGVRHSAIVGPQGVSCLEASR